MIEIDESLLVRLAGASVFGQGLHRFEENCVRDIVTTDTTTNAIVQGGRQHAVRLRHTHRIIEGACDCDVSDGIEFCKHCVAVALHLQEQQTPVKSIDKRSALRQIYRYLSTLTHEELLEEFLETIKQDRVLRDDLLQQARLSSEALSYSELKKMINDVAAEDYMHEPQEIRAYFQCLESMLARLTEFTDKLDLLVLLRGVEHAIKRLNVDLGLIDYLGDFPERSMEMLVQLHLGTVSRLNWTPPELAFYLVDRSLTESWHPFPWDADLYARKLGDTFSRAIFSEIETRMARLAKPGTPRTKEGESTRQPLVELRANLEAAAASGD